MISKELLSLLVSLVLINLCQASSKPLLVSDIDGYLGQSLEYYVSEDNIQNVSELNLAEFTQSDLEVPNFGISEASVWMRLQIQNDTDEKSYVLLLNQPTLSEIELYQGYGQKYSHILSGGISDLAGNWYDSNTNFRYHFSLLNGETTEFLIKVESGDQMQIPIQIFSETEYLKKQTNDSTFFGVYAGIILVMLLYNIFVFVSTRDLSYLYYVIYIAIVGLTQSNYLGFSFPLLYPSFNWLGLNGTYFYGASVGIAAIFFMRSYINTRLHAPKMDRVLNVFTLIYFISVVLVFFDLRNLSYQIIQVNAGTLAVYMLWLAGKLARSGNRAAKFFIIAWSMFLISVGVFLAKDFGVLPYNEFTYKAMVYGSAIEVILLSFALADRINQLKKEKETEQAARIEAIEENERIVTQQNVILEAKVEERTKELETSNHELQNTLGELQSTQSQLVEAEKMASLGQMTAGIAHELNNPINFVSSNISPLARDIKDVMEVLDKYESLDPDKDNFKSEWESTKELKEEVELDYVKGEIQQLLEGIQEGANRTAEIVKGLRVFSRLDEDALKKADLNECLESTLVILKSSINNQVQVRRKLSSDLPEINCYPGKLNQVFMNIITNGAQATMDLKNKKDERFVEVETTHDENHVFVRIADNGVGMPESVKAKIFDPFFTTKDVGEGTGLGLSIVLGIINDHNGKIEVNTQEGEGTEFLLTLPRTL